MAKKTKAAVQDILTNVVDVSDVDTTAPADEPISTFMDMHHVSRLFYLQERVTGAVKDVSLKQHAAKILELQLQVEQETLQRKQAEFATKYAAMAQEHKELLAIQEQVITEYNQYRAVLEAEYDLDLNKATIDDTTGRVTYL